MFKGNHIITATRRRKVPNDSRHEEIRGREQLLANPGEE